MEVFASLLKTTAQKSPQPLPKPIRVRVTREIYDVKKNQILTTSSLFETFPTVDDFFGWLGSKGPVVMKYNLLNGTEPEVIIRIDLMTSQNLVK
jgi:hypothetical protein